MLAQLMQGFGDTTKPVKQRLAPLALLMQATGDAEQQRAIIDQMITAGLPPMLQAAADARGDDGAGCQPSPLISRSCNDWQLPRSRGPDRRGRGHPVRSQIFLRLRWRY
jgi:hypothetical protein